MVPLAGNLKRFRHFDHHVGLDLPTLRESQRRGLVLGVAFGRAVVGPRGDHFDLFGAQAPVIGEVAILRIGEPGRHFLRDHGRLERLGPGTRFRVSQQRHRRDFTRAMAFLAVLLQDRQDVLIECHIVRSGQRCHSQKTTRNRNAQNPHPFVPPWHTVHGTHCISPGGPEWEG